MNSDNPTHHCTPTGYSIILPPGWTGIPLRDHNATDAAVRKIVEKACGDLPPSFPRDRVTPYRLEIEGRLRKGINEARKGDGLDLYLPVYERGRVPLGASFVVAETASPRGAAADANSLLALMTAESDASHCETVTVAETTAVRRDALVGGKSKEDVEAASRRVDYVIPVPKDSTRCVVVSFSTVGAGDPEDEIAEATTELFDAIMTTFRWRAA